MHKGELRVKCLSKIIFFIWFLLSFIIQSPSGIQSADLLSSKPQRRPLCYAAPLYFKLLFIVAESDWIAYLTKNSGCLIFQSEHWRGNCCSDETMEGQIKEWKEVIDIKSNETFWDKMSCNWITPTLSLSLSFVYLCRASLFFFTFICKFQTLFIFPPLSFNIYVFIFGNVFVSSIFLSFSLSFFLWPLYPSVNFFIFSFILSILVVRRWVF